MPSDSEREELPPVREVRGRLAWEMGCVLTGLVYNLSPGSDKSAKYSSHPPDLVFLDLVYVCVRFIFIMLIGT